VSVKRSGAMQCDGMRCDATDNERKERNGTQTERRLTERGEGRGTPTQTQTDRQTGIRERENAEERKSGAPSVRSEVDFQFAGGGADE
jgi:hypothetical protein